jgi:dienelactone hydrolase
MFALIEIDSMLDAAERKSTESTLAKIKVPYQTSLYGSVSHGFGVRGNMSDKRARYAKEEAYLQAVRWLDTWLKE